MPAEERSGGSCGKRQDMEAREQAANDPSDPLSQWPPRLVGAGASDAGQGSTASRKRKRVQACVGMTSRAGSTPRNNCGWCFDARGCLWAQHGRVVILLPWYQRPYMCTRYTCTYVHVYHGQYLAS